VRYRADVNNRELFIALTLDVAALTTLLYLSGGATNPFTSLYLLQVTLAAVLLDAPSTWSLVALVCMNFAWLTAYYRPLTLPQQGLAMRSVCISPARSSAWCSMPCCSSCS